jgi:hypothetical protein
LTLSPAIEPLLRSGVSIGNEVMALGAVSNPTISLAIWRCSIQAVLAQSPAAGIETATLDIDRVVAPLEPAHAVLQAAEGVASDLVDDIDRLLTIFRAISECKKVRLYLATKRTDACRKFHADFVNLRLITTYVGPGTHWVPDRAVDRRVLAHPPLSPHDANREIVRDGRAIRRAKPGDVLLMKGERSAPGHAVVHRSPPIETRGLSRLVLTLTTAD